MATLARVPTAAILARAQMVVTLALALVLVLILELTMAALVSSYQLIPHFILTMHRY